MTSRRFLLRWVFALSIPLFLLLVPASWLPLPSLNPLQQRVLAIFALALLFWVMEIIPTYATSLLIVFLELILLSTEGLRWLRPTSLPPDALIPARDIMGCFASPIILLFLGGFFLAIAAQKTQLDQSLARILLRPFGHHPRWIMLGMMSITAFFSMFMSNTATTAMMLSILVPVLACFEEGDRSRSALALSIPIAANIGGMGTPIGTMPNAVALRYLAETKALRFSEWLLFGLPIVCILLVIAWFAMSLLFPPRLTHVSLQIEGRFRKGIDAILVYLVFVVTLLLWLTDTWHGMSTAVVALLPVVVFSATGIIGKEDLKKISWDVLWLATGGLALGLALERTGIIGKIAESIPFAQFSPLAILILFTLLAAIMANFMSHTATANLLLPIVTALGASLSSFAAYGGAKIIILAVTLACSLGMSYPISTPPNALAHATGLFETRDMTRIGWIVLAAGMLVVYAVLAFLQWSRLL